MEILAIVLIGGGIWLGVILIASWVNNSKRSDYR
jgi:hypothetical protein